MAKTLKIVGLDGMKCQWVAEQDFLLKFSGQLIDTLFLCFVLFDWVVLTWVWFERFLLSEQVGCQSYL